MKHKVLYTDSTMKDVEVERKILAAVDAELVMASATDESTLIREAEGCIGVMNEYAKIGPAVLEAWAKAGTVKCIAKQGIGVDTIDIDCATKCGIMVANVPDYCIDEVSSHTVALALAAWRQLKSFDEIIAAHDWQEIPVSPMLRIPGRICGIYGFGNIAQLVAKKMQVFGFETYTYDPFIPQEVCDRLNTKRVSSLEELASISDVMCIHTPLLSSTRHSVNAEIFAAMKAGVIIVNTSRGPVIDESALVAALDCGKVSSAGLDVFENEPLENDSALRGRSNVILTPHVAFYSEEAEVELREKVAKNIANVITNGEPVYWFNRRAMNA